MAQIVSYSMAYTMKMIICLIMHLCIEWDIDPIHVNPTALLCKIGISIMNERWPLIEHRLTNVAY